MTDGVVLLHGMARTSTSMRPMRHVLEQAGYAVLNLGYRSRHLSLEELSEVIDEPVLRFAHAFPGAVHVVGHSMGGLLARIYLARHRPPRLGRVVMLGTPNGGSEIADLLHRWPLYRIFFGPAGQQLTTTRDPAFTAALGRVDYALGIISGNRPLNRHVAGLLLGGANDGKVTVASTRLRGMTDHMIVGTSHTRLIRHPEALAGTLGFLRDGRFRIAPASRRSAA